MSKPEEDLFRCTEPVLDAQRLSTSEGTLEVIFFKCLILSPEMSRSHREESRAGQRLDLNNGAQIRPGDREGVRLKGRKR